MLLVDMISQVISRYYSHVKTLIKMFGFTEINGMLIVKNRKEEVKSSSKDIQRKLLFSKILRGIKN